MILLVMLLADADIMNTLLNTPMVVSLFASLLLDNIISVSDRAARVRILP